MTAPRRSLVADGQPADIAVPQRFPRNFGRSARWPVRAQATLRECQRWCGNARDRTENGGLAALGGQEPRAHMRRSRDGGGIRLSCSHVSQSDTPSRSWQVLTVNLFRDSVFQVVRCEVEEARVRAACTPGGCSPCRPSVGQYGARPPNRARQTRGSSLHGPRVRQNPERPSRPAHQTANRSLRRPRGGRYRERPPHRAHQTRRRSPRRSSNDQNPERHRRPPGKGSFTPHIFPSDPTRSSVRHTRWFYARRITASLSLRSPRP